MLLNICGAGALLSWLYAWATFVLFSFFRQIYPLPETLGIFSLAAILTLIHRRRRWRKIQVIGIHLASLAGAGLWVVYVFYYRLEPLLNTDWLIDFYNRPKDQQEWFLLIFVLGYTIVFWIAGIRFALQIKSYTCACSRFDRGMIAFFCLFLIKLIMQIRMGIQSQESMAVILIFPFFIFSLTEIGLARSQGEGQPKEYLLGYHAVGALASFTIGALIIGAAVFMFFLPYLKMASVVGYDLMQSAARPLAPLVIAAIKFIFDPNKMDAAFSDRSPAYDATGISGEPGAWILLVQKILLWGCGTIILLVAGVALGLGICYILRWLFKKPAAGNEINGQWNILRWWHAIKAYLLTCYAWIRRTAAKRSALEFYAALQRWGGSSGLRQAPNETPMEYGRRLALRFPNLKNEILLIVEMLQWEVYGEYYLNAKQLAKTRQAWKKLLSPTNLPLRIKSILTNS